MTQLSLIDPAIHPIVTEAMLSDAQLRSAIAFMRATMPADRPAPDWPVVEALGETEGRRTAWAVDDAGLRYVVVGRLIFRVGEFGIMNADLRKAAEEVFGRLDAQRRVAA